MGRFLGLVRVHAQAVRDLMPDLVEVGRELGQIRSVSRVGPHHHVNGSVDVFRVFSARAPKSSLRANGRWVRLETTHSLHDDSDGPCVAIIITIRCFGRSPVDISAHVLTVPIAIIVLPDGLAEVSQNRVGKG